MTVHFPFQNSYVALPTNFFARVAPTPVEKPRLIKLNRPLARHLGLDPDDHFASKGGYLVRLEGPKGTKVRADGTWTVPD